MESESKMPLPIQFSVRTLLLIATNVAILATFGQIDDYAFGGYGKLVKGYAILLTIYAWRYAFIRSQLSTRDKWIGFVTVSAISLPYIYLCIGSMFYEPFGLPPSKWFGTPIWLFAIPFLSFLLFDLNQQRFSATAFIVRSLVEIVVVFHVWSYIWLWIQMVFEWAWI